MSEPTSLVLRLAGPLQAWGSPADGNRRETAEAPTKSGVIGLLAAAQGRRRSDPILDLLELRLGVRIDQPGRVLRDYHTVSDYRGAVLLTATVDSKGRQKPASTGKTTAITERFYLQDAVFAVAVSGPRDLLEGLHDAVLAPQFPLALGRRSCAPTLPLVVSGPDGGLWGGSVDAALAAAPWQATPRYLNRMKRRTIGAVVSLPLLVDDPQGNEVWQDIPTTFSLPDRAFTTRVVRRAWVDIPTGLEAADTALHDPFALLGW